MKIMQHWLRTHAEQQPDLIALISENRQFTYEQLYNESLQLAGQLREKGVKPGTHVAMAGHNSERYILLIHALILLGAVIVPLNIRLTVAEIGQQIEFAECNYFLCDDDIHDDHFITQQRHVYTFSDSISTEVDYSGSFTQQSLSDTILLLFTSGTSGNPKCVELTYGNLFYSALGTKLRLAVSSRDTWLLSLPLYHIGGFSMLARTILYGIPLIVPASIDTDGLISAIGRHDPSFISLVPTMMKRFLERNLEANRSHKTVLLGGGPIPDGLLEQCAEYGWKIATTYGTTETSSQIATRHADDTRNTGSVGRPLPFNEIQIVDENTNEVPDGLEGEITVSSPVIMKGYYRRNDLTKQVLRDGRFHTGDYGYRSDSDYLYVVSRRSDLIVSGGENINPVEVENVLSTHPDIRDVCVIPYTDAEWGEVPAAAIVSNKDAVTLESIKQFLTGKIASYKIPKIVFLCDALPYTSTGKVQRDLVRKECTRIGRFQ